MDPTAVMGKRIGAYVIDALIGTIVFVIIFLGFADRIETGVDLCGLADDGTLCFFAGDTMYIAEGGNAAAIFALSVGTWVFIMGTLIQGLTGGTPGKLMVGLRVVDQETGQQASFGKCAGRSVMWIVDGQPFGVPLVGLITGAASKGHRRVGDMVAKTLVVDKNSVGHPPTVPGLTIAPGSYTPAPPGGFTPPPPGGFTPPPPPVADTSFPIPPPADAPVSSPPSEPAAPAAPSTPAVSHDGVSGPKWDPDRNAYIQWDPQLNQWMTWDDSAEEWRPLT